MSLQRTTQMKYKEISGTINSYEPENGVVNEDCSVTYSYENSLGFDVVLIRSDDSRSPLPNKYNADSRFVVYTHYKFTSAGVTAEYNRICNKGDSIYKNEVINAYNESSENKYINIGFTTCMIYKFNQFTNIQGKFQTTKLKEFGCFVSLDNNDTTEESFDFGETVVKRQSHGVGVKYDIINNTDGVRNYWIMFGNTPTLLSTRTSLYLEDGIYLTNTSISGEDITRYTLDRMSELGIYETKDEAKAHGELSKVELTHERQSLELQTRVESLKNAAKEAQLTQLTNEFTLRSTRRNNEVKEDDTLREIVSRMSVLETMEKKLSLRSVKKEKKRKKKSWKKERKYEKKLRSFDMAEREAKYRQQHELAKITESKEKTKSYIEYAKTGATILTAALAISVAYQSYRRSQEY